METQLEWKKVNTDIGGHKVRFYAADIPEHLQAKYGKQVTIHMTLSSMRCTNAKFRTWDTMVDGEGPRWNTLGWDSLRNAQKSVQETLDHNFNSII